MYGLLGLAYIEPELRENRGELAAAAGGRLPRLIELEDIRGDLHCHTTASDGKSSIEEMALAARERGYEYLAITDHSASHGFGNDVSPEQLRRQIELVREANAQIEGIELLAGSEVNILPDGSLDYEDELLGELDWVIASVHTSFGMGEQAMTERMIAAIEHPLVDAIGHPTGRLIERREPYAIDLDAVFAAAARSGHDARDQRQPRPARPLRHPRARRGARGRADPDRLRRPPHGHAREHALGRGHRAARVAERRGCGQHAAVAGACEARQASAAVAARHPDLRKQTRQQLLCDQAIDRRTAERREQFQRARGVVGGGSSRAMRSAPARSSLDQPRVELAGDRQRRVGAGRRGGDEQAAVGERLELGDPVVLAAGRADEHARAAQQRPVLAARKHPAQTHTLLGQLDSGPLAELLRRLAPATTSLLAGASHRSPGRRARGRAPSSWGWPRR